MGRETRMVPKDWKHPKDIDGNYKPLLIGFTKDLKRWEIGNRKWNQGLRDNYNGGWKPKDKDLLNMSYEEWEGQKPNKEDYMPEWREHKLTHIMMYEYTSEGTPISPAFKTPEELARWLTDNNASAFGRMTASYEDWLNTCKSGGAVSMIWNGKELKSGVSAFNESEDNNANNP